MTWQKMTIYGEKGMYKSMLGTWSALAGALRWARKLTYALK